jgi:molybdopterin-guanine dinucleotide biosynthesis protein A
MPSQLKADTGRAGIVLAGGGSTRFEAGDKALASLGGEPMLRHVVDSVAPVVDDVLVSCRDDQRGAFEAALDGADVTLVPDPIDGLGPVAGLRTALRETDRLTAVVTAVDMPLVPSAFLAHLLDRVEGSTTAGVAVEHGRRQPLPAAVNVRAATAAATEVLDHGGSLGDVVDSLAPVVVPERHVHATVDPDRLLDVDTRADLERAERRLARTARPRSRSPAPGLSTKSGPTGDRRREN